VGGGVVGTRELPSFFMGIGELLSFTSVIGGFPSSSFETEETRRT